MFASLRLSQRPFTSTSGRGRRIVGFAAVGSVLTPTLLRAQAAESAGTDAEESAGNIEIAVSPGGGDAPRV